MADAPEPGLVLRERYRLLHPLDRGGMGNVWAAHDTSLDVDVAVKFINVPRQSGAAKIEHELAVRLVHEARVIAQLKHPAIVNVTDVAQSEWDQPFVVMELLEGEDLGALLQKSGPLPPEQAVGYLLPIAQALVVAHEKGVVHRDLKPDNVFLTKRDGAVQPKLLDFGVAKSDRKERMHVTQAGVMHGSPAYMSPEQVQGEDTDVRSDVWSFCMSLYELMTGKLPFERPTQVAISLAILSEEVEPLSRVAGIDEKLSNIVARGLNKEPERRFRDFNELGRALASWLSARGVTHDAAGTALAIWTAQNGSDRPVTIARSVPGGRTALFVLAGIGLLAFIGLAAFLFVGPTPSSDSALVNVEAPSTTASASAEPTSFEPVAVPPPSASATSTATAATPPRVRPAGPTLDKEEPAPRHAARKKRDSATTPERPIAPDEPEPAPAPAPAPPAEPPPSPDVPSP